MCVWEKACVHMCVSVCVYVCCCEAVVMWPFFHPSRQSINLSKTHHLSGISHCWDSCSPSHSAAYLLYLKIRTAPNLENDTTWALSSTKAGPHDRKYRAMNSYAGGSHEDETHYSNRKESRNSPHIRYQTTYESRSTLGIFTYILRWWFHLMMYYWQIKVLKLGCNNL
jgi:hypothetical protein